MQVILLWEKEGEGLNIYPFLIETLWESSEEKHCSSLICNCQSPSSPPIPIDMQAHKLKKHSPSALPWGNYKKPPKPMFSLIGGWPSNWKGWPRIMRTSNSGWLRNKRTNGSGWLSRYTPPSGRSSLRESGQFVEASSMVSLCHCQVWFWSHMLSEWSIHCHHYFKTWWHHFPSVNKQPSMLDQHSTSSSPCTRYPGYWHSSEASVFTCPLSQAQEMGLLPWQHTWRSKQ